jgi:chemosensory pili system protein ChpE
MLATAIAGAIMAISFSAPPGPVAVETIRRGLAGGFRPALYVQLGSIIGDVTWCALALLGLAPLVQIAWVRGLLGVTGVAVLVYLGLAGLREAFGQQALVAGTISNPSHAGAFRSGLAISMANPMAVAYWLSVGGALVAAGVAGTTPAQTSAFMAGFMGGTLAWALAMAVAVRWGKQALSPVIFRWIKVGCSSALLVFGLSLGAHLFSGLL